MVVHIAAYDWRSITSLLNWCQTTLPVQFLIWHFLNNIHQPPTFAPSVGDLEQHINIRKLTFVSWYTLRYLFLGWLDIYICIYIYICHCHFPTLYKYSKVNIHILVYFEKLFLGWLDIYIHTHIYIHGSAILHPRCRMNSTPNQPNPPSNLPHT
jgi:hypothetical protein